MVAVLLLPPSCPSQGCSSRSRFSWQGTGMRRGSMKGAVCAGARRRLGHHGTSPSVAPGTAREHGKLPQKGDILVSGSCCLSRGSSCSAAPGLGAAEPAPEQLAGRQDPPFLPSKPGVSTEPSSHPRILSRVLGSRGHRTLHSSPTWKLPALANTAKPQKRGFPDEPRHQGDNPEEATAYF